MVHPKEWSADEFETLLTNPQLSDERVAALLPQRTAAAVHITRSGIHAFHSDGDISMLSQMMRSRLEASGGSVVCSVCAETF